MPDQTTNVVTRADRQTGGIGVIDAAKVIPDQAANVVTRAIHQTGGVGVGDGAVGVVLTNQAADVAAADHQTGGVGVGGDGAAVLPDQAADIGTLDHQTSGVGVGDGAAQGVISDQAADVAVAVNAFFSPIIIIWRGFIFTCRFTDIKRTEVRNCITYRIGSFSIVNTFPT